MSIEGEIVKGYLDSVVSDMKSDMTNKGPAPFRNMNATRETSNSIKSKVVETPSLIIGTITANRSLLVLETGRKPGKFPPVDSIRKWIVDKGIVPKGISVDSLAFLIGRKIAREGTNIFKTGGTGIISDNITQKGIQGMFEQLFNAKRLQVSKQLGDDLKNIDDGN